MFRKFLKALKNKVIICIVVLLFSQMIVVYYTYSTNIKTDYYQKSCRLGSQTINNIENKMALVENSIIVYSKSVNMPADEIRNSVLSRVKNYCAGVMDAFVLYKGSITANTNSSFIHKTQIIKDIYESVKDCDSGEPTWMLLKEKKTGRKDSFNNFVFCVLKLKNSDDAYLCVQLSEDFIYPSDATEIFLSEVPDVYVEFPGNAVLSTTANSEIPERIKNVLTDANGFAKKGEYAYVSRKIEGKGITVNIALPLGYLNNYLRTIQTILTLTALLIVALAIVLWRLYENSIKRGLENLYQSIGDFRDKIETDYLDSHSEVSKK